MGPTSYRTSLVSPILQTLPKPHGTNNFLCDLDWLISHNPELLELGDPRECPEAWRAFLLRCSRHIWTRMVRKAVDTSNFDPCGHDHGTVCIPTSCPICNISIPLSSLGGHLSVVHGWKNPARAFAPDSVCRVCMRDFQTRPNLLKHIAYRSPPCFSILMKWYSKLPDDEVSRLDAIDLVNVKSLKSKGRAAYFTGKPVLRIHGPLLSSD